TSAEGGLLTLSLPPEQARAARDLAAGRYIKLCVSDTGCGMDPQTLNRAIEPFFSTKEVGKGPGLGLSMIQGLALPLRGAPGLLGDVGRGTRAELWLPVANGAAVAAVPDS